MRRPSSLTPDRSMHFSRPGHISNDGSVGDTGVVDSIASRWPSARKFDGYSYLTHPECNSLTETLRSELAAVLHERRDYLRTHLVVSGKYRNPSFLFGDISDARPMESDRRKEPFSLLIACLELSPASRRPAADQGHR